MVIHPIGRAAMATPPPVRTILPGFEYVGPGQVALVTKDGRVLIGTPEEVVYALIQHIWYGQSLSCGYYSFPILSTVQQFLNWTFLPGPKSASPTNTSPGGNRNLTDWKGLHEDPTSWFNETDQGETPCTAMTDEIVQRWLAFDGRLPADNQRFASAPGKGGLVIAGIVEGSTVYVNLRDHATACRAGALLRGLTHLLGYVHLQEGEADSLPGKTTTRAQFRDALVNGVALPVDTLARTRWGQRRPVLTLVSQSAHFAHTEQGGGITQAQIDASLVTSLIRFAGPTWWLEHYGDGLHLLTPGTQLLGRMHGRLVFEIEAHGRSPSMVMRTALYQDGKLLLFYQPPAGQVTLDADTFGMPFQHGVRFKDAAGDIALFGFEVFQNMIVRANASRAPAGDPSQVVARVARDYLSPGVSVKNSASTTIRDTTPDEYGIGGSTYRLPYWAPHQEMNVAAHL